MWNNNEIFKFVWISVVNNEGCLKWSNQEENVSEIMELLFKIIDLISNFRLTVLFNESF